MRVVRAANLPDTLTHRDFTFICQVISHDAFYERAFPSSVFTQQGVKSAGFEFQRDLVVRDKRPEPFRDVDELKSRRLSV